MWLFKMSFYQSKTVLNFRKPISKLLSTHIVQPKHCFLSLSYIHNRSCYPWCQKSSCERKSRKRFCNSFITSSQKFRNLHSVVPRVSYSCLGKSENAKSNTVKNLLTKRCFATNSTNFTLRNPVMKDYVYSLIEEFEVLEQQVEMAFRDKRSEIRLKELSQVVDVIRTLKMRYEEVEELIKLQQDPEMKSLAEDDMMSCIEDIDHLESELVNHLMMDDKVDEFDIILEVTPGVGGQEAMLFALEIFNMYAGYAAHRGWDFVEVDRKTSESGGVLSATATVSGRGVYREMKFESGVHRVQRIPKTEVKGRIHTSTMSVAILPQPSEIDVVINNKDVRVDVFRASGKGGQHVNVTDSAVRVTHLPTGMVAECQQSRSQTQNRETALKILRTRLYEKEYEAQLSKQKTQRKLQVGNRNRSEKIRTYNFPQDRITDHRLKNNYHNIDMFMEGGQKLESMVTELIEESKRENLQITLDEFEESRNLKEKQQKR